MKKWVPHSMQPIPVLHIVPKLAGGGVENQLLAVVHAYDRNNFAPAVCTRGEQLHISRELEAAGIEVHYVGYRRRRAFDLRLVLDLYLIMKKYQIKVVRTHQYYANLHGRIAALMAGVPCIVASVHNRYRDDRKLLRRVMNHLLARLTDSVIAVSEEVKKDIMRYDRIHPDKITVIYNGVDLGRFSAADGEAARQELGIPLSMRVIGTVGRMALQKGHPYLIEAFTAIARRHPNVMLLLVGDGPMLKRLQEQAASPDIKDRIVFAGWRKNIPDMLSAMDIFVFPSLWEGLGNALIEAMAMGRPIIASDIPPINEIVQSGKNAILVPPSDSAALDSALESVMTNESLARALGIAGRERSTAFSIEATVKKYSGLFLTILAGKKKTVGTALIVLLNTVLNCDM